MQSLFTCAGSFFLLWLIHSFCWLNEVAAAAAIHPEQRGNYTTQRLQYNLTDISFNAVDSLMFEVPIEERGNLSAWKSIYRDFPIEVLAEVIAPIEATPGKSPLVVFLHGPSYTCYKPRTRRDSGVITVEWPCENGLLIYPNYQGFRYVAEVLASQGYITVSISANGIYEVDDYPRSPDSEGLAARSRLIRHHLNLWSQWNEDGSDPWNGTFRGLVDMNQVVLVGHRLAGQAIHRAAIDVSSSDPFQIVGLVSYAPTTTNQQVTPDVHSATLIPTRYMEQTILNSQAAYVDASRDIANSQALRSAVIITGANYDYFNTERTPGLTTLEGIFSYDAGMQITDEEQRTVAVVYTAALVRLATLRDVQMLPLLDGSFFRPAAIGRVNVTTNSVGGTGYRLVYKPQRSGQPLLRNGMSGGECYHEQAPLCRDNSFSYFDTTPHWPIRNALTSPQALELKWNNSIGASGVFSVHSKHSDFTRHDRIDIRIANFNQIGVSFDIVVVDGNGSNATLPSNLASIEGWPKTKNASRVSFIRKSDVNLGNITEVHLIARNNSGRVWVLDVAVSQARVVRPAVLNLPALSIESVELLEGDNGTLHYDLRIFSDQPLRLPGSIWIESEKTKHRIDIAPNASNVVASIPFSWMGNTAISNPYTLSFRADVRIYAMKGLVTSTSHGSIQVYDDDLPPILSVVSRNAIATEGQSLHWTLTRTYTFSAYPTPISFRIVPPANGTELTTGDVPASWLSSYLRSPPSIPVPLSSIPDMYINARFEPNKTSVTVSIPIRDGGTDVDRVIRLRPRDLDPRQLNVSGVALVGTVLAQR